MLAASIVVLTDRQDRGCVLAEAVCPPDACRIVGIKETRAGLDAVADWRDPGSNGQSAIAMQQIGRAIAASSEISARIASTVVKQTAAASEISHNVAETGRSTQNMSINLLQALGPAAEPDSAASQVQIGAAAQATQSLGVKQEVDCFLRNIQAA